MYNRSNIRRGEMKWKKVDMKSVECNTFNRSVFPFVMSTAQWRRCFSYWVRKFSRIAARIVAMTLTHFQSKGKFILNRAHGANVVFNVIYPIMSSRSVVTTGTIFCHQNHTKKPNIPHSRNWKHATHRHRNELKSNHIHLTTTTYTTRCLHMWWRFFFVKGESKLKFENVHVHLGVGRYCGLKQKKARKEIESPARRLAWKCLWRKL